MVPLEQPGLALDEALETATTTTTGSDIEVISCDTSVGNGASDQYFRIASHLDEVAAATASTLEPRCPVNLRAGSAPSIDECVFCVCV